jgi:hypothetical protein
MIWIAPSKKCTGNATLGRTASDHGNVIEIIGKFGGADQLQSLLYAA